MSGDPSPSGSEKARPKYLVRPTSDDKGDLKRDFGFTKRKMVDWLAPGQLARTGLKAVMSGLFGAYADKREVMAALHQDLDEHDYSDRKEIWIDYVADLGDGFDATYTMASLISAERLTVGGEETRRGEILVFGGDQVYPTASFEEYHNRMMIPYQAALPWVSESGPEHHVYAIPGNHDWYDGLSNFTRIFCRDGWIGGRRTKQCRSYFALKLPHNWWLWGIDIQLEGFIDQPQIDYFEEHAKSVKPGDRIILCTAEPSWVYAKTKGPEAFRPLAFFEDRVIREKAKARADVTLTGDLHHYVRYESADQQTQRIIAGGGGAYLYATHQMPDDLEIQEGKGDDGKKAKTAYRRAEKTFPSQEKSRGMVASCFSLPWRSWRFGVFVAFIYMLYVGLVQSASLTLPGSSFLENLRPSTFASALSNFFWILERAPAVLLFTLLIIGGTIGFCEAKGKLARSVIGILHGSAHLLLAVTLIWGFSHLNPHLPWLQGRSPGSWLSVVTSLGEMLVFGGFFGGFLMALYLILCSVLGKFHTNEVFSSQRIADFKNFLRLHIDSSGKLTIYPVGVETVCKEWELQPKGEPTDPWWKPKQPIRAELIEGPIKVPIEIP
jgi:3',5'-cyclic AMP phosphodiesterase CpdA